MNLSLLGWSENWDKWRTEDSEVARVTAVHRGLYRVISLEGEFNSYLSGKFHHSALVESDYPAVGDWVTIGPMFLDEGGKQAVSLESVLPRKTKISRITAGEKSSEQMIVANVDYAFIVSSVNDDFNSKRLQRYMLLAKDGDVNPVIVFSKADLCSNILDLVKVVEEKFPDTPVVLTSSKKEEGIDVLKSYLCPGKTGVFIGSSGVGKSTLVNSLLNQNIQKTQSIRESDSKGRHTTSARELFFIPDGGMIIDTPGLREIQVFGSEEALQEVFKLIDGLTKDCKFSDCTHTNEPACAIQNALKEKVISSADMEIFHKILREMEHSNQKMDKQQSSNRKRKWKEVNINMKKRRKFKERS